MTYPFRLRAAHDIQSAGARVCNGAVRAVPFAISKLRQLIVQLHLCLALTAADRTSE